MIIIKSKLRKIISCIVILTFIFMNFGSHFVFASENPKILIKFSNTESNTKTELKGASFKI